MYSLSGNQFPLLSFLQAPACSPSLDFSRNTTNILDKIENTRKRKFSEIEGKEPEVCQNFPESEVFKSRASIKTIRTTFDYIGAKKRYLSRVREICEAESIGILDFSLSCLKKVIVPAFSEKNLIIRTPLPAEFERISDELHYCPEDELFDLIEKGGVGESQAESSRLLVVQKENRKNAIHGAVHFVFSKSEPICHVISVQILPDWQRKGQGFLLLACVIIEAMEKGCSRISLINSIESASFYEKFGFYPDSCKENWSQISKEERIAILRNPKLEEPIFLDLQSTETSGLIHQHLVYFFKSK